jgi:L-asparaginase type II
MPPWRIASFTALVVTTAMAGWLSAPAFGQQTGSAPPAAAAPSDTFRPKVRLIATGGTISMKSGGRLSADELVTSIPTLDRYVRVETEQFSNTASSSLTLAQWLDLARRLNVAFHEDPDLSGVVVSTGTDTLEETAYFLNLTVKTEKPVVVVGSMRNSSTIGYEGPANLLAGFRVAADPASKGKGVLVVLNDEINAARDVTKTDALRLDTFQTRGYGVLGVVDADRVVYYRIGIKRHTAASEFDVSQVKALPRVDVVLVYQDASGDVIKSLVDLGAQGIVVASAGAGALSGTQGEGIQYAVGKGVFVVTATRTGSGRIAAGGRGGVPGTSQGRPQTGFRIAAEDLAPIKARVLLMLALTTTRDGGEIQRMFTEY